MRLQSTTLCFVHFSASAHVTATPQGFDDGCLSIWQGALTGGSDNSAAFNEIGFAILVGRFRLSCSVRC